jgi:hypothetical protein
LSEEATAADPPIAVAAAELGPAQTEKAAGIYFMVQFKDATSVVYERVVSDPAPHPLAIEAVLQRELNTLRFGYELDVANRLQRMQQQMSGPPEIPCPNCKSILPPEDAARALAGKMIFCPRCHTKIGGA